MPARDPLLLFRVLLTLGRRAGFPFGEAFDLAASTALAYLSDRRARETWELLKRYEAAVAEVYVGEPAASVARTPVGEEAPGGENGLSSKAESRCGR